MSVAIALRKTRFLRANASLSGAAEIGRDWHKACAHKWEDEFQDNSI